MWERAERGEPPHSFSVAPSRRPAVDHEPSGIEGSEPFDAARAAPPAGRGPSLAPRLAALFAQALALHQAGRLAEAETLYRAILEADPGAFRRAPYLGIVHLQRGEHIAALRNIDAALKINPSIAAAHNNRGAALAALGRLDEAAESYGRAVALAPDYVDACSTAATR